MDMKMKLVRVVCKDSSAQDDYEKALEIEARAYEMLWQARNLFTKVKNEFPRASEHIKNIIQARRILDQE